MADRILSRDPISYFPNGFPLYLAALKWILPADWVVEATILLNVAMSVATVFLTGILATRLWDSRTLGLIAAGAVALFPNQLNYTRQLTSEAPTLFLTVLALYLLTRNKIFAAGSVMQMASFFRTTLSPVIAMVFVLLFILSPTHEGRKKALSWAAGALLLFVAHFSLLKLGYLKPWAQFHNILISTRSSGAHINFDTSHFTSEEIAHPERDYVRFAVAHPIPFLEQRLLALNELWGWPMGDERSLAAKLLIAIRLPLFLLALWATVTFRSRAAVYFFFSPVAAITLCHTMSFATPRFSFVAEPFLILLAVGMLPRITPRFLKKFRESL